MIKTIKHLAIFIAILLTCIGNTYAMVQDEEGKLVAVRNQAITKMLDSKEDLLRELNQIDALNGQEKLRKLREFACNNLKMNTSHFRRIRIMDIFYLFAKYDNLISDKITPIDQQIVTKIRNALTEDFATFNNVALQNRLQEGNFPIGHWNPNQKIQPTTEIEITHGGGMGYLLNCFDNKEWGYRLERGGLGIQVHPHCSAYNNQLGEERGPWYAYNAMTHSLDFPAVLTGTVQAKYLMPANNQYEAAIRVSDLKHIKNAKITFVTSDAIRESIGIPYSTPTKEFCKLMPPSLIERLKRFNEQHYVAPKPGLIKPKTTGDKPAPRPIEKKPVPPVITKKPTPSKPVISPKRSPIQPKATSGTRAPRNRGKKMVAPTVTKKVAAPKASSRKKPSRTITKKVAAPKASARKKPSRTITKKVATPKASTRRKTSRSITKKVNPHKPIARKKTSRRK